MIEISNVSKSIEDKVILDNVSLKIKQGSIYGLIGTNGAGKTSLIKSIMGIWEPDLGEIKIDGINTSVDPSFRHFTSYVSDEINIPTSYNVSDAKKLYKLAFNMFDETYFNEINQMFKISLDSKVRELSKGMAVKLSIMLNLSKKPKYLIMDEPLAGLDPIIRRETVKLLFADAAERGTTIFISSHNLADIERFCDTFAVLDDSKIKFSDSIEEAKKKIKKMQAVFPKGVPKDINEFCGISNINISGRVARFITSDYNENLHTQLSAKGASIIETIDAGLDEIFFHIMEGYANE